MSTYTGSITLASSTGDYGIKLSHEKIYKFVSDGTTIDLTPDTISIKCFSKKSGTRTDLQCSQYNLKIYINNDSSELITDILTGLEGRIKSQKEGPWELILPNIIVTNTTDYELNLGYLLSCELKEVQEGAQFYERYQKLLALRALIVSENVPVLIEAYSQNSFLAAQTFSIEFGTSENMAKFAVTATSIQAAVNNSKLSFDENEGLVIRNGGFRIINAYEESGEDQEELLFGYDETSNSLFIKGSGEFTGEITAPSGSIGGFRIIDGVLYSEAGITEEGSELNYEKALIKLNGLTGEVYSKTITLGEGVTIEKYLALGNYAKIFNPQDEDSGGDVLRIIANDESTIFSLNQNGILQLGSIILDGNQSKINGNSFSITPDQATFNNINATGKISTAVFEINKIQAMGGLMLFKPTYKVKSSTVASDEIQLILEEDLSLEIDQSNPDYVYLISENNDQYGYSEHFLTTIKNINEINGEKIVSVTRGTENISTIVGMVHIGKQKDLIIGVNSTDATNVGLYSRGITVSEFSPNSSYRSSLRVFLGDLGSLNRDLGLQTSGFGLYGENVYLTGSLTTKLISNDSTVTYAGINTINQAVSTQVLNDDSPIIFWAGAEGGSNEAIGRSKFHVTKNGSLYAQQGVFSGLIQGAEIHSADIYAARIRGEAENDGLSLIDRAKINFCIDTSNKIFSIGSGGFIWGDNKTFISIDSEKGVSFSGKQGIFESLEIASSEAIYTTLQERSITFKKNNQMVGRVAYATDYVSIASYAQSTDEIRVKKEGIDLMSNVVFLQNSLKLSEKMQYKQAKNSNNEIIGYDLVII